jgi:hypothetical protein
MVTFGSCDLAYSVGEGTGMTSGPKVQDAYRKVLVAAKKHGVAVIGGPVLTPNVEGCRQALEGRRDDLLPWPGLIGLPGVLRADRTSSGRAISGSQWTRPPMPASGFPSQSRISSGLW